MYVVNRRSSGVVKLVVVRSVFVKEVGYPKTSFLVRSCSAGRLKSALEKAAVFCVSVSRFVVSCQLSVVGRR